MARRARPRIPTLEMRITFEPSRVSPACMVQAYEQVVPLRRRPTGAGAASAGGGGTADATCRKETQIMNSTQVAIYARVSSDQQAEAHTVASQVAALRERVAADGLAVPEAMQFLDVPRGAGLCGRPRPTGARWARRP